MLPLLWNKLTPVFCDCDPNSFNADPKSVERFITRKTSAILAVHVFGCPANIPALARLARKYNLRLIYDAAHGFGASYRNKPLGRYGDAEPLYKRAIAIDEKALGPDHPDVAIDLNNLAELYHDQGRTAEAKLLLKRVLAIREKASSK